MPAKKGYTNGYSPTLLGREEGSAQAVSAKNTAAKKIDPQLICLIPKNCQAIFTKKLFIQQPSVQPSKSRITPKT
jgi:hypothetical protein